MKVIRDGGVVIELTRNEAEHLRTIHGAFSRPKMNDHLQGYNVDAERAREVSRDLYEQLAAVYPTPNDLWK